MTNDRGMGEQLGPSPRYSVCEVSQNFHWRGKPGRLIGGERDQVEESQEFLARIQERYPDVELGVYDGVDHDWIPLELDSA